MALANHPAAMDYPIYVRLVSDDLLVAVFGNSWV
jgi:hypothetical protein